MPHLIVEVSSNIIDHINHHQLFSPLHQLLQQKLPTDILSCKSRLVAHDRYYLGDGNQPNAFMHLTFKIMPGRDKKKLTILCQEIIDYLKNYAQELKTENTITISLELLELDDYYLKFTL